MRGCAILALVVSVASAAPAWAAADCSALLTQGFDCAVPITPGQPIGDLTTYGVGVQQTGAGGFTPVHKMSPLNVGDQVPIGSQGMTFITAGPACQSLQLPANAVVKVTAVGDCAGVQIVRPGATAGGSNGAGLALGVAAVGGGVAAILLSNNQKQISP